MGASRFFAATVAVCLLSGLIAVPAFAEPTSTQRQVEEGLTCQCGCGLTVASCNHLECGFAVPARKKIAESLAGGEAGEQIIDDFKKEYGEKVLSSPVAEGFNILAWVAPYLGIFVAGSLMFLFFRRRGAAHGTEPSLPGIDAASIGTEPDERVARLQQEVEDLQR